MGSLEGLQRGRWAEAIAIAWLIQKGYQVFPGFSGNESCDMIALKGAEVLRVEVKCASEYTKAVKYSVMVKDFGLFDTLLVVTPDGEVLQDPSPKDCYGANPGIPRAPAWNKGTTGLTTTGPHTKHEFSNGGRVKREYNSTKPH